MNAKPLTVICATPTMAELVGLYVHHHPGLDPKSAAQYGYALRSLERFYGYPLRACDFSEELLLPWLSHRLAKVAPKTAKRERGDLLTLWRFGCNRGLVSAPPFGIPAVQVPKRSPNSWTPAEYSRIIEACRCLTGEVRETTIAKALWWESLSTFLFYVGCRIGAAMSVTTDDIDADRCTVRLRSDAAKTGVEQVLMLNHATIAAIRRMGTDGRDMVWPWPYGRRRLWEQYKAILRTANLPADRSSMFQRTRRTTYTLCVKYGSKEVASRQLGHKTDMSRYYLDESQLAISQAANLLPQL